MSKAFRLCLPIALMLALAACSGSDTTPPEQVTVSGATETTPATEDTTATEQPLPTRDGHPGIQVASLPVGGGSGGLQGDGSQCLTVSWVLSNDPIPAGVAVEVTGAEFPDGEYRVTNDPCEGPHCVGYLFHGSERACGLPVRPTDSAATELSHTEINVSMSGRVLCNDYEGASCKTLVQDAEPVGSTLPLKVPVTPQSPETSSAETSSAHTSSTGTASTGTSSTDSGGGTAPETSSTSPGG